MPLDPEVAAFLESQKGQPPRSNLTIAETRDRMRAAAVLAGSAPVMAHVENIAVGGGVRVRQYWPKHDAALPLLVYFHGGRFISGDLDSHDPLCRVLAAKTGCRVLAVDYRLAPEHRFPSAADDSVLAVKWALGQGVPVGVAGDSAGGNLAAVAAWVYRKRGLRCQALIYPMMDATCGLPSHAAFAEGYGPSSDDMKHGWKEYLGSSTNPRDPRVSPLFESDLAGLAPSLVVLAEYDSLRDEGEAYGRRLTEAQVPTVVQQYTGAIHGFFTMGGVMAVARSAIADVCRYLRDRL